MTFALLQSDDYLAADDRALLFTPATPWPNLTAATVVLRFGGTVDGVYTNLLEVTAVSVSRTLIVAELTALQSAALYVATDPADGETVTLDFQLVATLATTTTATLETGTVTLAPEP